MSLDLIFRGATVYNGTGAPGRKMDVGLKDGRIAAVGDGVAGELANRCRYVELSTQPGFQQAFLRHIGFHPSTRAAP